MNLTLRTTAALSRMRRRSTGQSRSLLACRRHGEGMERHGSAVEAVRVSLSETEDAPDETKPRSILQRTAGRDPLRKPFAVLAVVLAFSMAAQPARAIQHNPPYADVFGAGWTDGLNTEESAQRLAYYMGLAGYNDFTNLNKKASTSMAAGWAPDDAIWAAFGHAMPGAMGFCDADGKPCAYDAISNVWANVGMGGSCDAPHECLSTVGGLSDIRFMLFAGCESGLDGRPGSLKDGNLVDVARYYGVDNAYGFTKLVYWPMGMDFASFLGIELKNGQTINLSMWRAAQDVKNRWFGNAHGWTSYYGSTVDINDKVVPAAYGR